MKASESHLAAIDLGTNSFHLVVVRLRGEGKFEVIGDEKESVRLGSGAGDLNFIKPDAMDRGIAVLKRFVQIARSLNADIRAVATSAVREAENKEAFLERARVECGLEVEVIPGKEEGRLIYLGILQALPLYNKRIVTMDIGGGSTELLVGVAGQPEFIVSHKIGAIRLKDGFFAEEPLRQSAVLECRRAIRIAIASSLDQIRSVGFETAVGSSGTIETLARMALLDTNPNASEETRGLVLKRSDLDRITAKILEAPTHHKRARLPGLDEKRADIIVGGAILLQEILSGLGIEELLISPFALREGVIFDTLIRRSGAQTFFPDIRRTSVQHLAEAMLGRDPRHLESSQHIAMLAVRILDELFRLGLVDELSLEDSLLLQSAGLLHNAGLIISHSAHHKHSYYIIKNSEFLMGFSSLEIEIIALTARYHRKATPSRKHGEFAALPPEAQRKVRLFAGILRIAVALDRSMKSAVANVRLSPRGAELEFQVEAARDHSGAPADVSLELWAAENKADFFAEQVNRVCRFTTKDLTASQTPPQPY